jgi:hypothetical protein
VISFPITLHFDNNRGCQVPHLWVWYDASTTSDDFAPTGEDAFGLVYQIAVRRPRFRFKFKAGQGTAGPWEPLTLERLYQALQETADTMSPAKIWCRGDKAFVYHVEPRAPEAEPAEVFLQRLAFKAGI